MVDFAFNSHEYFWASTISGTTWSRPGKANTYNMYFVEWTSLNKTGKVGLSNRYLFFSSIDKLRIRNNCLHHSHPHSYIHSLTHPHIHPRVHPHTHTHTATNTHTRINAHSLSPPFSPKFYSTRLPVASLSDSTCGKTELNLKLFALCKISDSVNGTIFVFVCVDVWERYSVYERECECE